MAAGLRPITSELVETIARSEPHFRSAPNLTKAIWTRVSASRYQDWKGGGASDRGAVHEPDPGVPSSFCQRISDLPSSSKSAAAATCHVGPRLGRAAPPVTVVPSMNQTAGVPSSFCQRISDLPSLLKSAAAAACHVGPGLGRAAPPMTCAVHEPDPRVPSSFCQRLSDLPSPLKSAAASTYHVGPTLGRRRRQ